MKTARTLLAALTLSLVPVAATAQDFPSKPIRLIVPFPPGGPNDIIARVVSQKMQDILKQTIVIDNRSGQGGVVGTDAVAKAPPDGYTIGIASAGALAISPSMEKVAYDTLKDLQPITLVAKVPEMLVVATNIPASNMKELVALAKSQPGKLSYASPGTGTPQHIAGEVLKRQAGIDIVHVPYRGANFTDVIGGRVTMTFMNAGSILPSVREGKLRGLAVTSLKRSPNMPEFPTMVEAGVPDFEVISWFGLLAPAGTPPPIIAKLHRQAVEIVQQPQMVENFGKIGLDVTADPPEAFATIIRTDTAKWAKVIKDAGIKGE
jgi:tripartite-type tricarboxylate transporter receptor subunit TctC